MSKQQSELTPRQRAEQAVTRVGKAYDELVKAVEKDDGELTDADIKKMFGFLGTVHASASQRAILAVTIAEAANGGFSLDKDYEPPRGIVPTTYAPTTGILPHSVIAPGQERLAGANKRIIPDDDDDVDFIDDD